MFHCSLCSESKICLYVFLIYFDKNNSKRTKWSSKNYFFSPKYLNLVSQKRILRPDSFSLHLPVEIVSRKRTNNDLLFDVRFSIYVCMKIFYFFLVYKYLHVISMSSYDVGFAKKNKNFTGATAERTQVIYGNSNLHKN